MYLFVRGSHPSRGTVSSSRAVMPPDGTRGPNTAGSSFMTGRYPAELRTTSCESYVPGREEKAARKRRRTTGNAHVHARQHAKA